MKYFTHSSNALQDDKILDLMMEYGLQGYGCFFAILELIAHNDGYLYLSYKAIAYRLHADEELVRAVVEDFNLFDITDNGAIYSPKFFEHQSAYTSKDTSNKRAEAGRKGGKQTQAKRKNDNLLEAKDDLLEAKDDLLEAKDDLLEAKDDLLEAKDDLLEAKDDLLEAKSSKEENKREENITPPIVPPLQEGEGENFNQIISTDPSTRQPADPSVPSNWQSYSEALNNDPALQKDFAALLNAYKQEFLRNGGAGKCQAPPSLKVAIFHCAQWLQDANGWLLLTGDVGCGKTTLANAVRNRYAELYPDRCIGLESYPQIMSYRLSTLYDKDDNEWLSYSNAPMVFIDELGTEPTRSRFKKETFPLQEFFKDRYAKNLPLILASNFNIQQLFERYGKPVADRFRECCTVITINTKSFR